MRCGNAIDVICYDNCRLTNSDVNGGGSKQSETCMIVRRDRGEVVEDNEVSVVSDDGGDDEVNRKGNVWPRSGVQAQSYYRKLSIWKNVIRGWAKYSSQQKCLDK